MVTPWWTRIATCCLLASTILPTPSTCYPLAVTPYSASIQNIPAQPKDRNSFQESPVIFARTSPPPRKRLRAKSKSPVAGPSNHHHSSHASTSESGSQSEEERGSTPPQSTRKQADTSPGNKIAKIGKHRVLKSNVKAESLKSENYRKQTMAAFPKYNWKGGIEADHILEAQTVASKINKHKTGAISVRCLEALKIPMNRHENLAPLTKKLNGEKNKRIKDFAYHDLYNHDKSPSQDPKYSIIKHFSSDLAKHHIDHKNAMLETASLVDKAMASDECKELHQTKLVTEGNKVLRQALHIVNHAQSSKVVADAARSNHT